MAQITLNSSGVASSGSLLLQTNGTTTQATVDTSGNLGLGVTPSAWRSGDKAIDVGATGTIYYQNANATLFGNNFYRAASNALTYKVTAGASYMIADGSTFAWNIAPSGTAGNAITFTQAMTLDASGNLLVNTTTAREKITVNGSVAASGQLIPYSGSTSLGYIGNDSSISGGSGSNIGLRSEAAMLFATGGSTERARIDSSGNLLINATASPAGHKGIYTYNPNSGSNTNLSNIGTSSGTAYHWTFLMNTTEVGSIRTTSSATTYATSSDYRLKENIAPMTGALAVVAQLNPCTYTWKVDGSSGQGFIAHELQAVLPDAVTGEKDAVNEDGSIRPQGIDTSFLVATLTAAIQELKAEFDAYKASHP